MVEEALVKKGNAVSYSPEILGERNWSAFEDKHKSREAIMEYIEMDVVLWAVGCVRK